ncbi:hypothetical protein CK203_051105 [Vitis vinifera]|uniref:Uncharacterized protein n=1 Tax=Vitis vinifera TaxID=29760 RepID=A0A438FVS9_VITVI|nr:hypothetical protein CK203_051105 [Vitis vinifera]
MMKKHTPPPFPQALHGKKGIRNASEILEVLRQCKSPLKYKDSSCPNHFSHDWRNCNGESFVRLGSKCEFATILCLQAIGTWSYLDKLWQSFWKLKFMKNQALELHSPLPKSFKVCKERTMEKRKSKQSEEKQRGQQLQSSFALLEHFRSPF